MDACLRLVDDFPRLLVVRTFSKIYGLSGLRAGYAVGSDSHLLAAVAPVLGINALTQAAVEYALRTGDAEIERRRHAVARERTVLTDRLRELGADVTDSQANFLWIRVRDMSGDQLANALRKQGVIVAPGGPLGEDHHIRAAIRDEPASNRLLRAVREPGLGRRDVEPDAGAARRREDAPALGDLLDEVTAPSLTSRHSTSPRGVRERRAVREQPGAGVGHQEAKPVARAAALEPHRCGRPGATVTHRVRHELRDEEQDVRLKDVRKLVRVLHDGSACRGAGLDATGQFEPEILDRWVHLGSFSAVPPRRPGAGAGRSSPGAWATRAEA